MPYRTTIFLVLLVIGIAFYWYELRPISIKSDCHEEAVKKAREVFQAKRAMNPISFKDYDVLTPDQQADVYLTEDYRVYYNDCLDWRGYW